MKKQIKNLSITFLIIVLSVALELTLGNLGVRDENIFLVFVVAILVILIETKNILYGAIASIILIMSFNFFFTVPYYSFVVDDANYFVSFFIFIVVSLIVGSLVLKLQKQIIISTSKEKRIMAMYEFSNQILNKHSKEETFNFVISFFKKYLNCDFYIFNKDSQCFGCLTSELEFLSEPIKYCLKRNIIVGKNENKFETIPYKIFPIKSKLFDFGVLIAKIEDRDFTKEESELIVNNLRELVIVLDREMIIEQQETTKLAMEKEKFKTSILRSLSHDLKTPLTSIQGGSNFLMESFNQIEDGSKLEIINDIYNESCSLSIFVTNLLNMTKFDEDKRIVNKQMESVDDILSEVYEKVNKRLQDKTLKTVQSKEMVLVYTDATLLAQVLINLIDNIIKHTKKGTTVTLEYRLTKKDVIFVVADDGGGINSKIINRIFDDFYSMTSKQDRFRSTGLGLSICKSIVEAHGGKINACNNELGGATFQFNIPNKGEDL